MKEKDITNTHTAVSHKSNRGIVIAIIATAVAMGGLSAIQYHVQRDANKQVTSQMNAQVDSLSKEIAQLKSDLTKTLESNHQQTAKPVTALTNQVTELDKQVTSQMNAQVDSLSKEIEQLKSDLTKTLESNHQQTVKPVTALTNQVTELDKQVTELKTAIENGGKEGAVMQARARRYWEAASKARAEGLETTNTLYLSALTYAEDKMEMLLEYVSWKKEQLEKLEEKDVEVARELIGNTMRICDSLLSQASVSDLEQLSGLKKALTELGDLQTKRENTWVAAHKAEIEGWLAELEAAPSSRLSEMMNSLSQIPAYSELEEARTKLLQGIEVRQLCLLGHEEELRLPTETDNMPWIAWLTHFRDRMRTRGGEGQATAEIRLQEYTQAEQLLTEAAQMKNEEVQQLLKEFTAIRGELRREVWMLEFHKLDRNNNASVQALISVADAFDADERNGIQGQVDDLRRCLMDKSIDEMMKQFSELNQAPKELRGQLLGSLYMQCYRTSRMLSEKQDVYQPQINSLNQLLENIRNAYKIETQQPVNDRQARLSKYADWAHEQLRKAEYQYKKAVDFWGPTGFEDAQRHLRYGWEDLMCINPGTLNEASASLYTKYERLKTQLNNDLKPENRSYPRPINLEDARFNP